MSETGDRLDHLRIPYEKIKFGKKLETQGYGTVFEGEFDDQRVALKQLNITNLANIKPKLLAEILTISRFRQHPNLVALLGFCDEKSNEIILVYEYVASGNLADKMIKRLKTIQRLEICLGAARGLEYLHTGVDDTTPGIVHGNIKPSKILLNSDANSSSKFVAKVSSFGLSKIVPGKGQKVLESSDEGMEKPTKESDVYSFGVLLLEVLCGVSEIVDTDDYQERHVTELVPKKMQQNQLRKIVHRDIGKEIKEESLETYAKIACQCVVEDPDARPTMARVVAELEKALILQGGEVTYVQIPVSRSIDETVVEEGSGVTAESNIQGNQHVDVLSRGTEEDVKDLIAGDKLYDAGEDNDDELSMVANTLESSNGEKNTVDDTSMEGVPNKIHIEDAKNDISNDPESDIDHLNDLNSKKESNIAVENEEEDTGKILIQNADKEISTNDPETTEEAKDDFDSNNKSKTTVENEEDDKSTKSSTSSESSSSDTSTSSDQEEQDSEILESERGNFNEGIEDELEHLRKPLEDTTCSNVIEEESKITEETIDDTNLPGQNFPVPISSSNDVESVPKDAQKENGDSMNDPESAGDITVDLKSYEESNIIGDEVNNESNITTSLKSNDGGDNNSAMDEKVSDAQLLSSTNGNSLPEEPVGEDGQEGDDNGEMVSSNITKEESKESVLNRTLTENAKNESSNNDPATEKEKSIVLNSKEESNITVETEENTSKILISTKDPETTEVPIDDFDSNNKSNIIEENKEYDESMRSTTTSESNNGDITTSTNQAAQDSEILKSDGGNFSEVIEDELEHLRIPSENIKFGKKIDVRGYGTMFEGEFNDQQVALKRLNITNLGNIKPKLLSAILNISRFRKHPNLVALIGFCDESNKEIILVYEYVSGGNLADKMSKHLTTIQRLQICLGAARGLEYLHSGIESVDSSPGIIHGHIKLSKILLNSNSDSSEFEAKVSGFGLPKLLPGHVEIAPKSTDPVHAVTGKLTKESDVYSFGVLLLEVLCGVPELVDTDDYQERHVTELVPKILERNMLRKIVHFDIRDEITTESLETYAKIACRCVMKNPEERPTMSEVVEELEKSLRLQGGKLSDVQIFGNSNGTSVPEAPMGEDDHEGHDNGQTMSSKATEEESKVTEEAIDDINLLGQSFPVPNLTSDDPAGVPKDAEKENGDILNDLNNNGSGLPEVLVGEHEGDDNGETVSSNITEEESKVGQSFPVPVLSSNDVEHVQEDGEKEKGNDMIVHESTEKITVDLKSNEESKIIEENEVNNENKITTSLSNSVMQEDATEEKDNILMMSTYNPHIKEITEVESIPDGNAKAELLNAEKPELIVNTREDFSYSATQTQKTESKRSNSTSSESSNGDGTTPSDHLLPKSPDNMKKTSKESRYCCCCICSCWRFISDRIVLYGELFWNKLVSFFAWITGQCASKRD